MGKLTNPEKILYPEDKITKKVLLKYYENIQEWILPYITSRPLTLFRCPHDYNDCFFQKHLSESSPSTLHSITIKEKKGTDEYCYITDAPGLLTLANLATLEFHPWGSRIEELESPDMIIFDLDPDPKMPWKKIVSAAFEVKQSLEELKIRSFVKTTGGKGLHVVIPIKPKYTWDEIKIFTKTFTEFLSLNNPDKYTHKISKSERTGKVYIDYLRNLRGATAIAPYSTRARLHAPIATPIHWDELTQKKKDTSYTIKNILNRMRYLKEDPWKEFFDVPQSLPLD